MLGRRGPGIKILLNGKEKYYPGNAGESAKIRVNGKMASLETIVKNNDKIEVQEARDGSPRELKISEVFPYGKSMVFLNEQPYLPPLTFYLNGKKAEAETLLKNGDRLEWQFGNLGTFLEMMELEAKSLSWKVNGLKVGLEHTLNPGDRITVQFLQEGISGTLLTKKNGEKEKIQEDSVGNTSLMITIHVNGEPIHVPAEPAPSFVSIFDYIDFDRSKPRGKLVMLHNGKPASLTGKLHSGDQIAVFWGSELQSGES